MKEVEGFYQPKKGPSATWRFLQVKHLCQQLVHAKAFPNKFGSEIKTPVMSVGEPFLLLCGEERDPLTR